MSRSALVLQRVEAGVTYGRVVKTTEINDLQKFAHEHVEVVARDKLMRNAAAAEVTGFGMTLTTGLGFSIAEGHVLDTLGRSFNTYPTGQAAAVLLAGAHASLPRIDLVYATLVVDQDAEALDMPYRRLLSPAEILAGVDPYDYPITNFNVATQRRNVAAVAVRQGTPASSPAAPAAGAGEVALFQVRVNAAAVSLNSGNVTDVRKIMKSLADALVRLDALEASPAFANFSEAVDDRVDALTVDSVYMVKTYNDPGNLLTLDVDVAALQGVLDSRYVNTTGDTMGGPLTISIGGGTDPYGGNNAGLHVAMNGAAGSSPIAVYGYGQAGIGPTDIAYGGFFTANANRALSGTATVSYGIFAETGGGHTRWAAFLNGNTHVAGALSVAGSISKGSGTFLIDDPLDPEAKDLVHGFVESSEYLLIYRVTVNMGGSNEAEVNLDVALGLPAGRLQQIGAELDVYGLHSSAPLNTYEATIAPSGAAMLLTVNSSDAGDTAAVKILICGRRGDPYIATDPWVNPATRKLVTQQPKLALTPGDEALLAVTQIAVEEGDARAGTGGARTLQHLIGRAGFPRYPAVTTDGKTPQHPVVYVAPGQTLAGPLDVLTGVNDAGGGVAWTLTDDSFELGDGTARIDIGAGQGQSAQSKVFLVTNTASAIPAGATITSIVAHVRRRQTGGDAESAVSDTGVWLVVGGAVVPGTEKSAGAWSKGAFEVAAYTFSGTDVAGLTDEDVDAGLGFAVQVTLGDENENEDVEAEFNQPKLTIFYEE